MKTLICMYKTEASGPLISAKQGDWFRCPLSQNSVWFSEVIGPNKWCTSEVIVPLSMKLQSCMCNQKIHRHMPGQCIEIMELRILITHIRIIMKIPEKISQFWLNQPNIFTVGNFQSWINLISWILQEQWIKQTH